jgi:hypothetical protein
VLDGEGGRLQLGVRAQLLQHPLDVPADRGEAEVQRPGDRLVVESPGDELEHLPLAGSQLVERKPAAWGLGRVARRPQPELTDAELDEIAAAIRATGAGEGPAIPGSRS